MIEFNFEYLGTFSENEIRMIVKKAISEVLKVMGFRGFVGAATGFRERF